MENGTHENARRPAADELTTLGATSEIRIATLRTDGTTRSLLPVWVVRVGDELFVRSSERFPPGTLQDTLTDHAMAALRLCVPVTGPDAHTTLADTTHRRPGSTIKAVGSRHGEREHGGEQLGSTGLLSTGVN